MQRLLVVLAFLLLSGFGPTGMQFTGFGQSKLAPSGPATITFLQCTTSAANGTSHTFSSQNTGTASADRRTIIGIMNEDGAATFGVDSVTVGGDSAAEIVDQGGTQFVNAAIYILTNAADTSEDVVVTHSESVTSAVICLWQANSLTSNTATDTENANNGTGAALTLDLNVSADGIAVGICGNVDAGGTWTFIGLTERDDASHFEANYGAGDYDEDSSASSPLTASCDSSTSTATVGVAASFR